MYISNYILINLILRKLCCWCINYEFKIQNAINHFLSYACTSVCSKLRFTGDQRTSDLYRAIQSPFHWMSTKFKIRMYIIVKTLTASAFYRSVLVVTKFRIENLNRQFSKWFTFSLPRDWIYFPNLHPSIWMVKWKEFFFQHQYFHKRKRVNALKQSICLKMEYLIIKFYKMWYKTMKNQYSLFSAGSHFKRRVLAAFCRK